MKMQIKPILALLVLIACLQLSGYAAPKHDHLHKMDRGYIKAALPFSYWLSTTWEGGYIDPYVYIEYKSFRVLYSTSLPYNVTISYNIYHGDTVGGDSNTENFATGTQGATSTYLGYFETFHQDSNTGYFSSTDLILNYVVQQ